MLKEKILANLKEAMKSGDAKKVGVLRMLSSALNNKKIEKRGATGVESELTDDEVMEVLNKEAKKRRESIAVFASNNREDLAEGEKFELGVIEEYLPAQMGEAEIRTVLEKIVANSSAKEFGPIMKEASKELKGKSDGALVSKILKEILG